MNRTLYLDVLRALSAPQAEAIIAAAETVGLPTVVYESSVASINELTRLGVLESPSFGSTFLSHQFRRILADVAPGQRFRRLSQEDRELVALGLVDVLTPIS